MPLAYASVAYGAVWALQAGQLELRIRQPGCAGLRAARPACMGLAHPLHHLYGDRGSDTEPFDDTRRRDRLARLSGSRTGQANVLYQSELVERHRLGSLACSLLLFADYNAGTNRWYALCCSSVVVVSASLMLAWLRLKSDSVWPAAVFHASHNLFVPGIFDNLIRNTGSTLWYTTEFGAALAATSAVFALYFWTRRTEIRDPVLTA